jgi:hypothetical protein
MEYFAPSWEEGSTITKAEFDNAILLVNDINEFRLAQNKEDQDEQVESAPFEADAAVEAFDGEDEVIEKKEEPKNTETKQDA